MMAFNIGSVRLWDFDAGKIKNGGNGNKRLI